MGPRDNTCDMPAPNFNGPRRNGLRLPHSGAIIGRIAEAMRLKSAFDGSQGFSSKTVQRYFKGERVEPERVGDILCQLIDAWVPLELSIARHDRRLNAVLKEYLPVYARFWDRLASQVNARDFEVTDAGDLSICVLRLVLLDIGIRWGAMACLGLLASRPGDFSLPAVGQLGATIDSRRALKTMSVEKLAIAAGVSPQTIDAWRTGRSMPSSDHIASLARALATDGDVQSFEHRLRLVVAVQDLRTYLTQLVGEKRIADMLEAMRRSAEIIYQSFCNALSGPNVPSLDVVEQDLWSAVVDGAHSTRGALMCEMLAEMALFRQEVAADFQALPGDWTGRISAWMRFFSSLPDEVLYAKSKLGVEVSSEELETWKQVYLVEELTMSGFDWKPDESHQMYRVSYLPEGKAITRMEQAQRAASTGNLPVAIMHALRAIHHAPTNAAYHFMLGAWLGELGMYTRRRRLMEAGLDACHRAVELEPNFGNARNEIGIILSNLRRHAEADAAFAAAEPYYGYHAHHWYVRGSNYVELGLLDAARACYDKALERSRDTEHIPVMRLLAAVLMKLGRTRDARALGKKVHHKTGVDPTLDWRKVLQIWPPGTEPV